jgi:WD40 repeat protein
MKRLFEWLLIVGMVLILLWSIAIINQKPQPLPPFNNAEWHPKEDIVAFYSATIIRVYTDTLQELYELNMPAEDDAYAIRITEIKWSPDGTKIAAHFFHSIGDAGLERVVIWDVTTNPKRVIFNVEDLRSPLAWSPDSQYIAAISLFDSSVEIYGLNGNQLGTYYYPSNLAGLSWHPLDNHRLAINYSSSILAIQSAVIIDPLAPDTPVVTLISSDAESVGIGFSPDGNFFAVTNYGLYEIEIRDNNFDLIHSISLGTDPRSEIEWLDGGISVSSSFDKNTRIFDISDLTHPVVLQGITYPHWKLDGTRIAITDTNGIRVLDGNTGNVLAGIQVDGTPLFAVWYHTKQLITIMMTGIGLLALLMLGFRYKQYGSRKDKIKRQ